MHVHFWTCFEVNGLLLISLWLCNQLSPDTGTGLSCWLLLDIQIFVVCYDKCVFVSICYVQLVVRLVSCLYGAATSDHLKNRPGSFFDFNYCCIHVCICKVRSSQDLSLSWSACGILSWFHITKMFSQNSRLVEWFTCSLILQKDMQPWEMYGLPSHRTTLYECYEDGSFTGTTDRSTDSKWAYPDPPYNQKESVICI